MEASTEFWQRTRERLAIRRVSGPARPPADAGVVLLCRVENGAEYAADFLRHYRALGVGHMIILDTGSTDNTVDLLTGPGVTVYRTSLPFKTHRLRMRRWLMGRCSPGTWTLSVDIDELFDYPFSARTPLPALIEYLQERGFTAMRAHMLDMFASGPVGSADAPPASSLPDRYPWYDLSGIEPISSPSPFGEDPAYHGGVRAQAFGGGHFWLTKHPLIRVGHDVEAFTENEHAIDRAHIADVTGVLLHFKFTERFPAYVRDAVSRGQHWNDSAEYRLYAQALAREPGFILKGPGAQRWTGVDALVDQGLLTASAEYRRLNACGTGSCTSAGAGASSAMA